jgi:apolipoprotein N-acyltransferase
VALWRSFAQPARYAALLAGALPVLAFPAPNVEFLAWIGLVPGLLLLRAAPTGREAAMRGWWFGAGYLLAALYWLTPNLGPGLLLVVIVLGAPWAGVGYASWRLLRGPAKASQPLRQQTQRQQPQRQQPRAVPMPAPTMPDADLPVRGSAPAAGPGPASPATAKPEIATPAGVRQAAAVFPLNRRYARARGLFAAPGATALQAAAALVVLPSSWVLIDWIRSWQGIGGPWAVYGASQWQHPVVLALAAVGGTWLISFALVASNTGVVIALTAARWTGRALGLAAAALAVAAGPAAYALTAAQYAKPPARHLTLALVQPGLEAGPQARLAAESRLTAGIRGADMIVWGESSVGYDLYAHPAVLGRLVKLSTRVGTPLLVSQDALSPTKAKSKVAVLIAPGGIEGTYIKTRLVPFGEYIPFRSLLGWLSSISRAAPQNMIAGHGAHVLHAVLPNGRRLTFGVLICFESSFPDMSAVDVRHGAQVLIFQTSDSTFQHSWALEQHASLAAIRAAESGRPAVQAALTGDSAAFDSRGRLLGWMGSSQRGVLRVTLALPPSSLRTPFDRFGDYVPWLAIVVVVASILVEINARGLMRRLLRR